MQAFFHQSEFDQPHPSRARAIIKAHPEVRRLMVRNPYTALIALSLVIMQSAIAYGMGTLGFGYWWLSLFRFFQGRRPPGLKAVEMWGRWFCINVAYAAAYDVGSGCFCGWPGFV